MLRGLVAAPAPLGLGCAAPAAHGVAGSCHPARARARTRTPGTLLGQEQLLARGHLRRSAMRWLFPLASVPLFLAL